MNLSRAHIVSLATTSGFRPETLEKVVRLGELLGDISRHPLLARVLVLKGGTALNLCFEAAPARLSVDLDFNYVGHLDRNQMLADRPEVERAVTLLGSAQGYQVQQSADEHAGRKLFFLYTATSGTRDRVEIDLNFLFRLPLSDPAMRSLWQPGDVERPRTMVASLEELATGKLCALLARAMPRDLFDAARLPTLAGSAWDSGKIRKLFIAIAGILDHPLHKYGRKRLERVTDAMIIEQLLPMLTQSDTPNAADLQTKAWATVGPLLVLDDAEVEYTNRLQRGELRPELLFPGDSQLAARIKNHPALVWKAENARKHATSKR